MKLRAVLTMKILLLATACAILPFVAQAADLVVVRSAGKDVPTAYNKLTPQQKERVGRALALLRQPPGNRPPASRRFRNHALTRAAVAVQTSPKAIDIACLYEEEIGVGCWIGDDFLRDHLGWRRRY